jgi:hypothetical protein
VLPSLSGLQHCRLINQLPTQVLTLAYSPANEPITKNERDSKTPHLLS